MLFRTYWLCAKSKAPFSYDERRWFTNRRHRPLGSKQQRTRGLRRRFANWRCCRNRNPLYLRTNFMSFLRNQILYLIFKPSNTKIYFVHQFKATFIVICFRFFSRKKAEKNSEENCLKRSKSRSSNMLSITQDIDESTKKYEWIWPKWKCNTSLPFKEDGSKNVKKLCWWRFL